MEIGVAKKVVQDRIEAVEPHLALLIVNFLVLAPGFREPEMIRLAHAPDREIIDLVLKAKCAIREHGSSMDSISTNVKQLENPYVNGRSNSPPLIVTGSRNTHLCTCFFSTCSNHVENKDYHFYWKEQEDDHGHPLSIVEDKVQNPMGYQLASMRADTIRASQQVYLTFPPESTFSAKDVADYFGDFGPLISVRIPKQKKRMFGFVAFVFDKSVEMILARGNVHLVGGTRIIVKPYRERNTSQRKSDDMMERLSCLPHHNLPNNNELNSMWDKLDVSNAPMQANGFGDTQQELDLSMISQLKWLQCDKQLNGFDSNSAVLDFLLADVRTDGDHHNDEEDGETTNLPDYSSECTDSNSNPLQGEEKGSPKKILQIDFLHEETAAVLEEQSPWNSIEE